jgi:hypothetical protein
VAETGRPHGQRGRQEHGIVVDVGQATESSGHVHVGGGEHPGVVEGPQRTRRVVGPAGIVERQRAHDLAHRPTSLPRPLA